MVHAAASEKAEAVFVAREIEKLIGGAGHHSIDTGAVDGTGGYSFGDIAVLFRLNAQARAFEEVLDERGIPFQTAGVRPAGLSLATRKALRGLTDPAQLLTELERLRSGDQALDANWDRVTALGHNSRDVADFLDRVSLSTPEDAFTAKAERVALLTLHAAKGLEFPVVFLAGCEAGLLPLNVDFLETRPDEERRLFYVGLTRAKERLYFTRAKHRRLFGRMSEPTASPFLDDIRVQLESLRAPELSRKRKQEKDQFKLF